MDYTYAMGRISSIIAKEESFVAFIEDATKTNNDTICSNGSFCWTEPTKKNGTNKEHPNDTTQSNVHEPGMILLFCYYQYFYFLLPTNILLFVMELQVLYLLMQKANNKDIGFDKAMKILTDNVKGAGTLTSMHLLSVLTLTGNCP